MKLKQLFLLGLAGFIVSCSNSDDSNENPSVSFEIPLETNNYWVYDVDFSSGTSRDSLYISNDNLINGITFKKFKTKVTPAAGFYSSSLRENGVRKDGNKLLLSGDLAVGGGQNLPVDIDLALDNFVIFQANASNNTQLDSQSGSFQQTVNYIPITVNYTLKSFAGESLDSYTTLNGDTFTNIKKIKIVITASASANLLGSNFPVLSSQDILVSYQFVAKNVGVVFTETTFSYSIEPAIATQLTIPATNTQNQTETLDIYAVN